MAKRAENNGLTDKQQRFIEEYCVDFNATQAAIRAGYSEKTAHNIGYENVRKPEISDEIKKRLSDLAMSAEEITRRLAQMGRGNLAPFLHNGAIDITTESARENLHLVRKVKITDNGTEIELHDAKDAIVQLAKMEGLFVDKIEHTGKDGEPIKVEIEIVEPTNRTRVH